MIYGVKFNKVKEEAVIWLEDNLKIKVEVVNGKMVKENIAVVMLKSREDKNTVMRNTCNLKGTKIYINEDFTAKEREIHWKVRKIAREWREDNQGANIKHMNKKLWLNDKLFIWNENRDELVEVEELERQEKEGRERRDDSRQAKN